MSAHIYPEHYVIRSRKVPILILATMLLACNEATTTTEPQFDTPIADCGDCFFRTAALFPSSNIYLGGSPVLGFVVSGDALVVSALPRGTTVSVQSDTIPAPAPPGPVLSEYVRFGAAPFKSVLSSLVNAGYTAPSDTIPAPAPPAPGVAASIQQLSNGNVIVWLATSYMASHGLSTSTSSLTLTVKNGKTTLYTGTVDVQVFAK